MLKSIINIFKTLLAALFPPKEDKPGNKPVIPPQGGIKLPQDGSEIKPDSIVIVANETEQIIVGPDEPHEEFDPQTIPGDQEIEKGEPVPEEDPGLPPVDEPEQPEVNVPKHKARYLWCLDNGHGKLTSGKRSPVFSLNGEDVQFFEYEFNRDIVKRITEVLDEKGVKYFITVPEINVDNFLKERVDRANEKASELPKIFVSIHSNAAPTAPGRDWAPDSVRGIETWYYHNSNRGRKIASVFHQHLIDNTGWKNRHLKSRPEKQFYVLRKTKMPAILTENGFYNNKEEVKLLMTDKIRQSIADAHIAAILEIEENGID